MMDGLQRAGLRLASVGAVWMAFGVGAVWMALGVGACGGSTEGGGLEDWGEGDASETRGLEDAAMDAACPSGGCDLTQDDAADTACPSGGCDLTQDAEADLTSDVWILPRPLVVMTFNTGTSLKPPLGLENEGFQAQQAAWCDEWYGNGLAWKAFVEEARVFIEEVKPDIVAFQEIFWTGECPGIPAQAQVGFVCEGWEQGDWTVAQVVVGSDYQVACNWGKPDKCAAVRKSTGRFLECASDFCLQGMVGSTVEGCGKGARIGQAMIELVSGGTLNLVTVHASSGFKEEDSQCRVRQFDQIFIDLGDGIPAARGDVNLILGDFNTDPGIMASSDPSAAHLLEFVGEGKPFHFITGVGPDAEKTYGGLVSIDHVISDSLVGDCWTAGVTEGHPPVSEAVGFDHHPTVCQVDRGPRSPAK